MKQEGIQEDQDFADVIEVAIDRIQ